MGLIYSNGFIGIKVDINDNEVYFHLQNYLFPAKCNINEYEWNVKAFNYNLTQNLSGYEMVCKKGEYGERIKKYFVEKKNIFFNESNGTTIIVDNKNVKIYNSDKKGLFIDTYRTVRQLLINDLLQRGGIVVHSSSVYMGAKGYLFVGNKGAGKTTSLFQYLNSSRSDVLYGSNERTILVPKDNNILMYGWPGTAFVGVGSIYSTIGLRKLINVHRKTGGTAYWLSMHQVVENDYVDRLIMMGEQAKNVKEKIWLTSSEIANLTNRKICNYGYLDKIIWPKLALEQLQCVYKTNRSINGEVIQDLTFFGDWMEEYRKPKKSNDEIWRKLRKVPQYEISGNDLYFNFDNSV